MSRITNQFMNSFELQVTEFESTTDYLNCGAIHFKIKTDKGADDFLEWVNFDDFNEAWELEKVDNHITSNEMTKIANLFYLTDNSVSQLRDHHYPIEEIQDTLQSWINNNIH